MKKRFLAIFIVVMMLFSQITVFASVPDSSTTSINPEDKLTDELKEVMSNTPDGEYIPIIVWLNDYGDEIVYSNLSSKYGFGINSNNENIYIKSKIDTRTKEYVEKELSKNPSMDIQNTQRLLEQPISLNNKNSLDFYKNTTEAQINEFINDSLTIAEVIEKTEKAQFLYDWRESRKSINNSIVREFTNKLNAKKVYDVETNELLTFVSLSCENSYINELIEYDEVKLVDYINPNIEIESSNEQADTTEETNEHPMLSNDYLGYDGTGIKIGVIEFDDNSVKQEVLLDTNNVHLKDKFSSGKIVENYSFCGIDEADRTVSNHTTLVVSIICGDEVNGYRGIAPNATVYYAPFNKFPSSSNVSEGGLFAAIDWLINDCNVSVINMSCGARYSVGNTNIYYSFIDQYFDCLVSQYRVTIIKSAGNTGDRISSPGLAMNVITVGNLTKEKTTDGRYKINSSSRYEENGTANKPDVVAFGTNVIMHGNTSTSDLSNSGTSFAAPQIAGTVALMMQANSDLIGKPDVIKSILISSAKSDIYPDTFHFVRTLHDGVTATCDTTNKAGGGLVNSIEAIKQALRNDFQRFYFSNNNTEITTNRYWFYQNETIEFTMVFEKGNHTILDSPYEIDINVQILNSNAEIMFDTLHKYHDENCTSCSSGIDNVESFKVTLPETDFYTFRIYVFKGDFEEIEGTSVPTIHNSTHNGIYISLNVSCGCDNKNIQSVFSQTYSYDHSCSNCGSTFSENFSYDNETVNVVNNGVDYGEVIHTIKFRTNPYTRVIIDNVYSCKFNETENSLYRIEIGYSVGAPEYKYTGYQQSISCVYTVYNKETGAYVCTVYDTIKIVYDTTIECSAYIVT